MQLWIPTIGDAFVLTTDWSFHLHHESRNCGMADALGKPFGGSWYHNPDKPQDVTLEATTELVVDRIYIRQGADEFDSLTFVIKQCPREVLVGERFWAKLHEVNTIQCTTTTSNNPVGPFAKNKYKADLKTKDPVTAAKLAAKLKSKEELELARKTVLKCIRDARYNANHVYGEHVMVLATDVATRTNAQRLHWGAGYLYSVTDMLGHLCRETTWFCAATRKLPDGVVERDFRVKWFEQSEIRSGGITVVIQDGNVILHRALSV
jgi:hypothetical protein